MFFFRERIWTLTADIFKKKINSFLNFAYLQADFIKYGIVFYEYSISDIFLWHSTFVSGSKWMHVNGVHVNTISDCSDIYKKTKTHLKTMSFHADLERNSKEISAAWLKQRLSISRCLHLTKNKSEHPPTKPREENAMYQQSSEVH